MNGVFSDSVITQCRQDVLKKLKSKFKNCQTADIEDAIENAIFKYIQAIKNNDRIERFDSIGKFESWLYIVTENEIIDIMKNGDKTGDLTFEIERNPDGSVKTAVPRTEKEILVATVKKHGFDFIKALANHYTSLGGKKTIEPIDNAKPPKEGSKTAADQKPKTIAEAMARHGSVNPGG